jgi:hypothetical protein
VHRIAAFVLAGGILWITGCATTPPSKAIDLSAPGWSVRQGQALWQPGNDKPEIAGDVVLSTHPSNGQYIQFSKTLPILSARIFPRGWEFENSAEQKHYSGRGNPPDRIVWLQLLRVLEGQKVDNRWTVAYPSGDFVTLEDQFRGERLRVQLQK